jgi:hypothetical protein
VDYKRGVWIAHVLGGNLRGYLGTDEPRSFAIEGDTLTNSDPYMLRQSAGTRATRAGTQHSRPLVFAHPYTTNAPARC